MVAQSFPNSSRIEAATRQHVGATLTSEQIVELVHVSNPEWKGGVYPSDAAGKRLEDGIITFRGKTAYGDLVLEYLGSNSFKVLPTEQIVRRPGSGKKVAPAPVPVPVPAPEKKPVTKKVAKKTAKASQPPVIAKQKARDTHVTQ
jgi:hypothetical protein